MIEKDTNKIHSLGPKKTSNINQPTQPTLPPKQIFTATAPTAFYHPKPILPIVTLPQPQPLVRYLLVQHPQFDTLVKQLTILRKKYDELLIKFDQKCTQQSLRENIQQVIESTHDIEAKMSRIVEDANHQMAVRSQEKQNQPTLQVDKARHERECLQIIETVNRASEKIEELEGKNAKLQEEIEKQKEWREVLEGENKRLRLMVQNVEKEKEEEIERLRRELKQVNELREMNERSLMEQSNYRSEYQQRPIQEKVLKGSSSSKSMKSGKVMTKSGSKISNVEYLREEVDEVVVNDISGFSRLTIGEDVSRVMSRVYE